VLLISDHGAVFIGSVSII